MTIEQKQCLLKYLGYYGGEIDGSYGPQTRAATKAFQDAYGLDPDGVFGPRTTSTQAKRICSTLRSVRAIRFSRLPASGLFHNNIPIIAKPPPAPWYGAGGGFMSLIRPMYSRSDKSGG